MKRKWSLVLGGIVLLVVLLGLCRLLGNNTKAKEEIIEEPILLAVEVQEETVTFSSEQPVTTAAPVTSSPEESLTAGEGSLPPEPSEEIPVPTPDATQTPEETATPTASPKATVTPEPAATSKPTATPQTTATPETPKADVTPTTPPARETQSPGVEETPESETGEGNHTHTFEKIYWYGEPSCSTRNNYYNLICRECGANGGDGEELVEHTPVSSISESADGCRIYQVTEAVCEVCGTDLGRSVIFLREEHSWVTGKTDPVWKDECEDFVSEEITYCQNCYQRK